MKQTILGPSVPTVGICINKSRLKIYNKETTPTYYLQKGQEFQIELYNPTSDSILSKIYLNGKIISQGGLILRPGERVFLERYIDIPNKFKFDTYEVANTSSVKQAIRDNGDIKVEFFRENQPVYYPPINILPIYYSTPLYGGYTYGTSGYGSSLTLTTTDNIGTTTNYFNSVASNSSSLRCTAQENSGLNQQSYADTSKAFNDRALSSSMNADAQKIKSLDNFKEFNSKSSKIETGRVEAGSHSNQNFEYVSKSFSYYAFHTVEYKLLPLSQKINTVEDINVKRYCVSCGNKLGKTDMYCSACGRKA